MLSAAGIAQSDDHNLMLGRLGSPFDLSDGGSQKAESQANRAALNVIHHPEEGSQGLAELILRGMRDFIESFGGGTSWLVRICPR